MRLFFAAPLDDGARAQVASIIERLARTGADYKWVEPENLHVTLAFLGETPERELPRLKEALKTAAAGRAAFSATFDCIGAFDSLRRPRVLWLGIGEGAQSLTKIAESLEGLTGDLRGFKAHLTLGRQRSTNGLGRLKSELAVLKDVSIESRVDRVLLLSSRLSGRGPLYEEVASEKLL